VSLSRIFALFLFYPYFFLVLLPIGPHSVLLLLLPLPLGMPRFNALTFARLKQLVGLNTLVFYRAA
jgi:hypothetical protein